MKYKFIWEDSFELECGFNPFHFFYVPPDKSGGNS